MSETRPTHRAAFRQPLVFPEPTSVAAAEARRLELQAAIGEIETQLADRDRRRLGGTRLTPTEYHAWRRTAISALSLKAAELRHVRAWLRGRAQPRAARAILADLILALGEVRLEGPDPALQAVAAALERARAELGL